MGMRRHIAIAAALLASGAAAADNNLVEVSLSLEDTQAAVRLAIQRLSRIHHELGSLRGDADFPASSVLPRLMREVAAFDRHVYRLREKAVASAQTGWPQWVWDEIRSGELKLQLGGHGPSALDGWLNLDLATSPTANDVGKPEMKVDLATEGLGFLPDGSCGIVYSSHMLQHLQYPIVTRSLLEEIRRVLRPGGLVRLVVPDAEVWMKEYVVGDRAGQSRFWAAVRQQYPSWDFRRGLLPNTAQFLGANSVWGWLDGVHQWAWDFELLFSELRTAGFTEVRRSEYMTSSFGEQESLVDFASPSAGHGHAGNGSWSLFIEAKRGPDTTLSEMSINDYLVSADRVLQLLLPRIGGSAWTVTRTMARLLRSFESLRLRDRPAMHTSAWASGPHVTLPATCRKGCNSF
eukprot:gnl/TRDRNA2_/TRDRNA2_171250_c0_seq21.p1 gnl/TRDRNA2_/TRDRNA2_171250_c0~~gnl/TRDRNA2_/TRDRNA2_171250_c0_seq21.p1  ORF type:complete len:405 (+),score=60.44 gnl/TRDRNA2_/TRDRNA2_171250_c0_seq21:58-1272(+)